jgi:hypothetical protein
MRKFYPPIFAIFLGIAFLSSCSSLNKTVYKQSPSLSFRKDDFDVTEQKSVEYTTTRILGIDWAHLFRQKTAEIDGQGVGTTRWIIYTRIPVIGDIATDLITEKTLNYSLYMLMKQNPGYDIVIYPSFETRVDKPGGLGLIYRTTTVKTTARLGKLNLEK